MSNAPIFLSPTPLNTYCFFSRFDTTTIPPHVLDELRKLDNGGEIFLDTHKILAFDSTPLLEMKMAQEDLHKIKPPKKITQTRPGFAFLKREGVGMNGGQFHDDDPW